MKLRFRFASLFVLLLVGVHAAFGDDTTDFVRLHTLIKPQPDEDQWLQVPWLSSVWEARKKAAMDGKPILLWEMDGHPLGCT